MRIHGTANLESEAGYALLNELRERFQGLDFYWHEHHINIIEPPRNMAEAEFLRNTRSVHDFVMGFKAALAFKQD